jgi:hypothetical protein
MGTIGGGEDNGANGSYATVGDGLHSIDKLEERLVVMESLLLSTKEQAGDKKE